MRICSVNKCGGRHEAKGFCRNHYRKFIKYGNPLEYTLGKPKEFIRNSMNTNTDDCIEWLFCLFPHGYGQVSTSKGKHEAAHRVALRMKVGPSPKDKPLALHSCHNRKCINWKHLRWGSSLDNMQDMASANRSLRGVLNKKAKLSEEQVAEIFSSEGSCVNVGKLYGVSPTTVNRIRLRKNWQHITSSL